MNKQEKKLHCPNCYSDDLKPCEATPQSEKCPAYRCLKCNIKFIITNPSYLNCNVATPKTEAKLVSPKTNLFDSINQPNVYTVELDNKTLNDFQKLRKAEGEDIRKTIVALMMYYENYDSLNIILLSDVLEKRQSYIKFTAQLANYLVHAQKKFPQVKVQFDTTTSHLGIFCRIGSNDSTLNSSFLGAIIASLIMYKSAEVLTGEIPMSYLGNRAALKHLLKQKLETKNIQIHWTKESVKIFV